MASRSRKVPQPSAAEERLRQLLPGSAAVVKDPIAEAETRSSGAGLSRMVDMRIPLWGILTAFGALAVMLVNMWLSVQQLTTAMIEVQATLKGGNSQATMNLLEVERVKARMERLEEMLRDVQQQHQTFLQQQYGPQPQQRRSGGSAP